MYKFENLNQSLIGMSKELIENGVSRKTRGFDCVELPYPVLICIENPCDRYITIKERKWNKVLPFIESLWLALGFNDLSVLPGKYVKSLYDFSDDGSTWRAGYGPRLRSFWGTPKDYYVGNKVEAIVFSDIPKSVDQFRFVIETLKRDINSRQSLITIADPVKDDFDKHDELKITKDQPCTRSIQFMMVDDKLDCTVYIRSNDILWGYSAINVFNFTLMQEYIANILGVPVGKYYHFANNLHYYDNFKDKVSYFASLDPLEYKSPSRFYYESKLTSLDHLDKLLDELYKFEQKVSKDPSIPIPLFYNDLFSDWAGVIKKYWSKDNINFINPYLNRLYYA
jgi:thymidylate synthase